MRSLPHCDELFQRFFDPWYDKANRQRRSFKATFPDILQHESLVGLTPTEANWLKGEPQQQVERQIDGMVDAVRKDWPTYLPVSGDINLDWIAAFDQYYDRERIDGVIGSSPPSNFSNDYVVICCEFGAALGHVLSVSQPRLIWRLDWPYWDSALLDPKTGTALPVFHWAIKKMSDYGVEDGFVAKIKACLQFLDEERRM